MKKTFVILLLFVGVVFAQQAFYPYDIVGDKTNPGRLHTKQAAWTSVGTFATGATTPGVTARTAALFSVTDPNNVSFSIGPGDNRIKFRCSSTTDADSTVFDVFVMHVRTTDGTDHFNRIGTLTFTTGTQTAGTATYKFADTVVSSNDLYSITDFSPIGNYIAEANIDVQGAKIIGICPTTITNTAILEWKGY